jgi:hypothetical protein
MKDKTGNVRDGSSRREFLGEAGGAGALLAVSPAFSESPQPDLRLRGPQREKRKKEKRTLFFNLSHESYSGHEYHLVTGTLRHRLRELAPGDATLARARRSNNLLAAVPDNQITHVAETVELHADSMNFGYVMKDANTTTGEWQMSSIFLIPPPRSVAYAYRQARATLSATASLKISAKRKKYGLPPAMTLQDLLDEQALQDTTDWATAMVNLHPEMLSADPNSGALIQTMYIQSVQATGQLAEVLGLAGPAMPQVGLPQDNPTGWATLVPYTDTDGMPLKSDKGHNQGLILYDPKWQPAINVPWVAAAMQPALRSVKDDERNLGADVTSAKTVPAGTIWTRHDGITSVAQAPGVEASNAKYTLSNITPNFDGYSCASQASLNDSSEITLSFKNWYVRYLALYMQFYDSDKHVVPISSLPPGIVPEGAFSTANNEFLVGSLTPEFTIYGIPCQVSSNSFTFTFPSSVASSAKILASGLGTGSHTFQDTETIGIVMTSLFNLVIPASLIALGIAQDIDVIVKTVFVPLALLVATEIAVGIPNGTPAQAAAIYWRAFVRGAVGPALKKFFTLFLPLLASFEVLDSAEDAIPIAGQILQAIGVLGTYAEISETTLEVSSSPWTYEYDLVGTYDLSLAIFPDTSKDPNGFPAAAATYKVTAIFDNGTPYVQTLNMPGTGVKSLPPVVFQGVPLGGNVVLTVGFYAVDGTQVGHGTTGSIPNLPPGGNVSGPAITITEDQLPINSSTVYQHKQKTGLDAEGNHMWICGAPAPLAPKGPPGCAPNPGNLCSFRNIAYSSGAGNIGYGWQSYHPAACNTGAAQLDQLANIPSVNTGSNAQAGYAASCPLTGPARLVYDPLGRSDVNFYLDTTNNKNILRQIQLNPPQFPGPNQAWGKFNLPADDLLLHPSGAVISIYQALSKMESLKIPAAPLTDDQAAVSLLAQMHAGQGVRPGLFNGPTAATITAEGVVLIVESGNNRIHAIDAAGNPVQHFSKQPAPYFLNLSATGGAGNTYLDIAAEFSGFIYVLSQTNSVYRLDIYDPDQSGTDPISTTTGFNAAKVTVDYWRNLYSLNYEVLMINGSLPPSGVTEPSISQWLPTTPPPCQGPQIKRAAVPKLASRRLLRRRDFWGLPINLFADA